jgi:hypothetical protein
MTLHDRGRGPDPGPPLGPLAVVFTLLFVGGVAVATALAGGDTFPSPFGSAATAASYFRDHRDAVRVSAFTQFAAAVPLAIYAATVSTRLRNYGIRVPGTTIALVGGVLAATMLALSGLLCWVLSRVEVTDSNGAFRVFHDLSFATGGVAHVVFLGLLVAGIAVPGLLANLLPRPLALTGLVIAVMAELASLALLIDGLAILVPIGRFTALGWLIAVGFMVRRNRVIRITGQN